MQIPADFQDVAAASITIHMFITGFHMTLEHSAISSNSEIQAVLTFHIISYLIYHRVLLLENSHTYKRYHVNKFHKMLALNTLFT